MDLCENDMLPEPAAYTVGYALTQKKIQSFLRPELLNYAREHGICFKRIDPANPLEEQGHFDIIIHKVSSLCQLVQGLRMQQTLSCLCLV